MREAFPKSKGGSCRKRPAVFAGVAEGVAGCRGIVNWTGGPFLQQIRSESVSSAYFRLFGVPIVVGRPFGEKEDVPHAAPVVLISEGLWKSRFGGDPEVVGKTMALGGEPHVIVGVVGDSFDFQDFGDAPEVWVPFQLDPTPWTRATTSMLRAD